MHDDHVIDAGRRELNPLTMAARPLVAWRRRRAGMCQAGPAGHAFTERLGQFALLRVGTQHLEDLGR